LTKPRRLSHPAYKLVQWSGFLYLTRKNKGNEYTEKLAEANVTICGASLRKPIPTIFGLFGDFTDLSNYAKLHVDWSRGFRLTGA
jgi:hypothetical protein